MLIATSPTEQLLIATGPTEQLLIATGQKAHTELY
jgi:hypothetical protein